VARPADAAEARRVWSERLRFEYLQEKLADKKPEEIVKTLTRRYENGYTMLAQYDSDEVLELYLATLARVFDPHSDYMGHGTLEDFRIQMKLSLFGIGAVLQSEDGYCKVVDVPAGGPAGRSGQIKAGDRIVAVGQKAAEPVDVVGMKLNKVVEMIRGPKGTEVRLTVIPADATDPAARKTIILVRDEIKLEEQEAKSKVIDLPGQNGKSLRLGMIDLPGFYAGGNGPGERGKSATDDVARLLKKLNQVKIQGLILDLRGNGGGSLDEAIRLTGLFIKDGPVVQEQDPDGSVNVDRDPDPTIAYAGPMIVLVNRGTASASEILAGALQDYGRAVIVGDSSTFGKGTVQSVMPLAQLFQRAQIKTKQDPGALKVTIQKFYRPSGASTQLKGVVPDIVLPSLTDAMDVGERVMDDALPWDAVKAAPFTPINAVKPHMAELRKRSVARVASDKDFTFVREEVEQYRKTVAMKQVSLNEAERRKTRQEADARQKARKAELAARPAAKEKVITITLKQVDTAGLPAPDTKTASVTSTRNRFTSATGEGPDTVLDEGKRILADLISLSAAK
jgi:carboxyl-terminal processing protease